MASNIILAGLIVTAITLAISLYKRTVPSHGNRTGAPPLPPGPRGLPLLGYLPFLGPNLHHEFAKMGHVYGPIFKLYIGTKLHVVINSSELAKVVTGELDESFANRDPHMAGLATSYGASDIAWAPNNASRRNLRKVLVQEVLSNVNLEASHSYRRREVRKAVKIVHGMLGTAVNINVISFSTVLNVLKSIVWGDSVVEGSKFSNLNEEIGRVVIGIIDITEGLNISDFFPAIARFDLQGVVKRMNDQMRQFDRIFEITIEERMKLNSRKSEERVEQGGKKDFLQVLLELLDQKSGPSINMTQLKAIVVVSIT